MGECDQVSIPTVAVLIPKAWNESEDFGRDPVDRCRPVPPEPNQAEDLENVLLENIKLKCNARQSPSSYSIRSFVQPQLYPGPSRSCGLKFQSPGMTDFTIPDIPRVNSGVLQEFLGCTYMLKYGKPSTGGGGGHDGVGLVLAGCRVPSNLTGQRSTAS
jgi:hypothetical protein